MKKKVSLTTGDASGGATVAHLRNELKQIRFMDLDSKKLPCDMHNFVKPLKVACVDTCGRQGIGHHTPFQMIWLFVTLLKKVRTGYGRPGLNEMWANVVNKLHNDKRWQTIALDKCK